MNVKLAYLGHSGLAEAGGQQLLSLAPNLAREQVAFDAPLLRPLRFREAVSALHDVVISDLRFKKRDKTAYKQWKADQQRREAEVRRQEHAHAVEMVSARANLPVPKDLERAFDSARRRYWDARKQYSSYLAKQDYELWRMLMPCDPVVTVADDVCFFECFSGDESSYGCLTAERGGAFGRCDNVKFGTTNVDYSWDLYNHFQALRSYRETRFRVDPHGFEVATAGQADYREEKIDLPAGWLRGFMQIQVAMGMPAVRVTLSREAVYSALAWLKRHKAKTSPRAMRFELLPDKPPRIVLEPWEQPIVSHGTRYQGPSVEPIRVWGTRRLIVLARVLPLAESFDVYLLGTGLPSFWVARMGEMYLTLGLSGWTTNDWTRGSALDLLAPPADPSRELIASVASVLRKRRAASFATIHADLAADARLVAADTANLSTNVAAALRHLAYSGQVIHDLSAGVYRWRQIMPQILGEAEMGAEHPEQTGLKTILARRRVEVEGVQEAPGGSRVIVGKADGTPAEILLDADGRIRRGKCLCGHFRSYGIRNGPCRHMMALRVVAAARSDGGVHPTARAGEELNYE